MGKTFIAYLTMQMHLLVNYKEQSDYSVHKK